MARLISRRSHLHTILLVGLAVVVGVFLLEPMIAVVISSLGSPPSPDAFVEIFGTSVHLTVILNTFEIAAVATILTIGFGFAYAIYLWHQTGLWRIVCGVAIFVPFFTGILVKNFAWTVILRDTGIVNSALGFADVDPIRLLFTRTAVYVGMVHYLLPFAVLPIYASLLRIDRSLLLAARSMGAGRITTFRTVTLPLATPGIVAASVIVFITGLGFFVTPAMLGGRRDQMIANLIDIYTNTLGDFQMSAALAVILAIAVLGLAPIALGHLRGGAGGGVSGLFTASARERPAPAAAATSNAEST